MSDITKLQELNEHLEKVHHYQIIYDHIEGIKKQLDYMLENDLIHVDYYELLIENLYKFIFS